MNFVLKYSYYMLYCMKLTIYSVCNDSIPDYNVTIFTMVLPKLSDSIYSILTVYWERNLKVLLVLILPVLSGKPSWNLSEVYKVPPIIKR